jgi:hypothetical protein
MAVINYVAEQNIQSGYVKVEWSGLTSADSAQPFSADGLELVSAHSSDGNLTVQGSNEISPTNFGTIMNIGSSAVDGPNVAPHFVGSVRPVYTGGATTTVAMMFLSRK